MRDIAQQRWIVWPVVALVLAGFTSIVGAASAVAAAAQSAPAKAHDHQHDHDHDHDHDHQHDHAGSPGRHVHGEITVNLVLEGNELTAELDSPAIHVVGFERAPQSDIERTRVETAHAWLASGRGFLGVPRAAGCRPAELDFSPPPAEAKHANYRARHQYRCANSAALEWMELWALRELEGVDKVTFNLIVNGRQKQIVLDGTLQRISLR